MAEITGDPSIAHSGASEMDTTETDESPDSLDVAASSDSKLTGSLAKAMMRPARTATPEIVPVGGVSDDEDKGPHDRSASGEPGVETADPPIKRKSSIWLRTVLVIVGLAGAVAARITVAEWQSDLVPNIGSAVAAIVIIALGMRKGR